MVCPRVRDAGYDEAGHRLAKPHRSVKFCQQGLKSQGRYLHSALATCGVHQHTTVLVPELHKDCTEDRTTRPPAAPPGRLPLRGSTKLFVRDTEQLSQLGQPAGASARDGPSPQTPTKTLMQQTVTNSPVDPNPSERKPEKKNP